jgi:hypothetical protein
MRSASPVAQKSWAERRRRCHFRTVPYLCLWVAIYNIRKIRDPGKASDPKTGERYLAGLSDVMQHQIEQQSVGVFRN